jgi:hypothetical protein
MNAEMNLKLLREIEANRAFILAAYQQNPDLLARAEPRIRQLLQPLPIDSDDLGEGSQEGARTSFES